MYLTTAKNSLMPHSLEGDWLYENNFHLKRHLLQFSESISITSLTSYIWHTCLLLAWMLLKLYLKNVYKRWCELIGFIMREMFTEFSACASWANHQPRHYLHLAESPTQAFFWVKFNTANIFQVTTLTHT